MQRPVSPAAIAGFEGDVATRTSKAEAVAMAGSDVVNRRQNRMDTASFLKLMRRLIARRCIYGVDLNPVVVHLARLSIWIHTFVPGLPLSLLHHNLVVGNSLVGIGQLSEINLTRASPATQSENWHPTSENGVTSAHSESGCHEVSMHFPR